MEKFSFYKELYHKENERRQEVMNALNIPIAVITALASAVYFFITTFDYNIESFLTIIFLISISAVIICLIIAIYFLIKAFSNFTKGYEYLGISYTQDLYDWNKELEDYYNEYPDTETTPQKEFESFLIESFVKHTEHNMYVNDKKYGHIYKSKKFIIITLILSMLTLIPFSYNFFKKDKEIYDVNLIENIEQINDIDIKWLNQKLDSILILQKKNKL